MSPLKGRPTKNILRLRVPEDLLAGSGGSCLEFLGGAQRAASLRYGLRQVENRMPG
jgi:hypothetical protein